ncbi:GDYXXLXY domain-containing protein [uncultured Sphingomonas sp.]|uniref:GDYXXLXY domain-containing protein n=1 Tax=uncultured Sphingomonas sp. TaxID=158754 RepID=UPI0035CB1AF0
MNRLLIIMAAAALPVAGSLGSIALREADLRDAIEWRIPIAGYNPRDPLRGRYITFQYIWSVEGDRRACGGGDDCRPCLEGRGERLRIAPEGASCAAPVDLKASGLRVANLSGVRTDPLTSTTRLWVSESRAPMLELQLRMRPMVAVARLSKTGRLTPIRLEPAK